MKIPLESSKDTREYREGLDETNQQTANMINTATGGPKEGNFAFQGTTSGSLAQTSQLGGTGSVGPPKNERIQVELQINHSGEVNRARYMP